MPTSSFPQFSCLAEALSGPASHHFGIGPDGRNRRAESYYQSVDSDVSFDVSNNRILCSISATGLLRNACIVKDVVPSRGMWDALPGVLAQKELIAGGPWPFSIRLQGEEWVDLHSIRGTTADLLGNLFPRFTYRLGPLVVRLLAFCPMTAGAASAAPAAVIVVLHLRNESERTVSAVLRTPSQVVDLGHLEERSDETCHEAITCLADTKWIPDRPEVALELTPGGSACLAFGLLLGGPGEELRQTGRLLRERSPLEWLNHTWRHHAERLGRLSIPDAPYFAEAFIRFRELCRQSVLRTGDGRFGGGFWGSDFIGGSAWASPRIWNKDNFHAMLPMAVFEPSLCADAILFFLRWSLPHAPYGPAAHRFVSPNRVTHSLTNALSGLVLAGAYYQWTGDKEFFLNHPEVLHLGRDLLNDVLRSRHGGPSLFPSIYISDGEARGDYHTGSNLVVWYAFGHMARLAEEVYQEPALAQQWSEHASRVKQAILTHCVGECSLGRRFLEGANADGTWVTCHDGEETDVALMPFYGFCEPDDPALINHSKLALSPENPLYAKGVDGIWWGDGHSLAATFPAWMTALAGAETEEEATGRLEQIARLTDVDGSIWWWPYRHPETDPANALRRDRWFSLEVFGEEQDVGVGKCGWAAGVYLCLFLNNLLGIRLDVPAHQVSLRPFWPWPEFTWEDCRLGSRRFGFSYQRSSDSILGRVTNQNGDAFSASIELLLPRARRVAACLCNGDTCRDIESGNRYGRPTVGISRTIASGETLELIVEYTVA